MDGLAFPSLEMISSEVFLPGGEDECRQDHRLVGMASDLRYHGLFMLWIMYPVCLCI